MKVLQREGEEDDHLGSARRRRLSRRLARKDEAGRQLRKLKLHPVRHHWELKSEAGHRGRDGDGVWILALVFVSVGLSVAARAAG